MARAAKGLQIVQQPPLKNPESRHDAFVRLATSRTENALMALQRLGKLVNRENYEPTEDEIAELLAALRSQIDLIQEGFEAGHEITGFRFRRKSGS